MSHSITTETDTIDYITERLTIVLVKNQDLSFSSLSRLAALRSDIDNTEIYLELVILSFVKYLQLDNSFKFTIKENVPAHKIFNALNLNDDRVNSHFVSFLTLIAPDIITVLCTVTSQIASEFAKQNVKNDTIDRIERIQEKVNKILLNDEASVVLSSKINENQIELKKQRKNKNQNLSFVEYLAGSSSKSKQKNRRKSYELSSEESNNTVSTNNSRQSVNNKKPLKRINLLPTVNDESETASQTSNRLAANRGVNIQELPNNDFDPLPSRDEINQAKYRNDLAKNDHDDVSSIVF